MRCAGETNGDSNRTFGEPHFQKDRLKLEERGECDEDMSGGLQRCDPFGGGSFAGLSEHTASGNHAWAAVLSGAVWAPLSLHSVGILLSPCPAGNLGHIW